MNNGVRVALAIVDDGDDDDEEEKKMCRTTEPKEFVCVFRRNKKSFQQFEKKE